VINYLPKYFSNKAIYLYVGVLLLCNILFFSGFLPIIWWVFGLAEVVGFFYFSNLLTLQWTDISPKAFTKNLFTSALVIRVVWVLFSYVFYTVMTGQPFEFDAGDVLFYHDTAYELANAGLINIDGVMGKTSPSDQGYIIYLSRIYLVFGNGVIIPRLLKAFYSAYVCVLIYKLAFRNFGEEVGRMSAIFCMLMPTLIYYSGMHLKEAEMVLLTVWFVERADLMLRNKKLNFIEVTATLILAASLFFFRTVLGATALFALFTALLFSSSRVVGFGKRTVLIVWILMAVGYFVGGSLSTEVEGVWAAKNTNQSSTLEFRTTRVGGNKLAKYASSAVFAPAIFMIPFPTVVNVPGQENIMMLNGGYYVKNIMAFFVMFALFWIVKNKKWRDFTLIGSFTLGYLLVIALSAFAQSERFHQPALPFLLIFAAFGISKVTNNTKKYFTWYMTLIFVVIVAWSWFKLAGRGLA